MCGKHVDVLHFRQQANPPRRLDVGHDAAGQREPSAVRSAGRHRAPARPQHVRPCAARGRRTARWRNRQWTRASGRRKAWPGHAVSITPSRTRTHGSSGLSASAIGRRVVGQRHDLAFVLELAHVEQVRHVLEEHADRVARGRCGDARRAARRERWRSSPTARRRDRRSSAPRTDRSREAHAAAAACAS